MNLLLKFDNKLSKDTSNRIVYDMVVKIYSFKKESWNNYLASIIKFYEEKGFLTIKQINTVLTYMVNRGYADGLYNSDNSISINVNSGIRYASGRIKYSSKSRRNSP